jgi:flagellar basal body P-ring formation protein FlgA
LLYHRFPDMQVDNLLTSKVRFWIVSLLFGLTFCEASFAKEKAVPPHSLGEIYAEVRDFLQQDQGGEGVTIDVLPLDSRLRLKACDVPLSLDYQRARSRSGKSIIQVRCSGVKPWRIFVSAVVRKVQNVVVTVAPILKGERVTEESLAFEEHDLSRLRQGYFEKKEQLKGKFAQRSIQGGVVLTPKMLFIPNLVDKGDQVTILFQQGDLKVQMKGVAMENGYRDGKIRVKNSSSGKMVEGVVTAPGRVLVTN